MFPSAPFANRTIVNLGKAAAALVAGASLVFAVAVFWRAADHRPVRDDAYGDLGKWLATIDAKDREIAEHHALRREFLELVRVTVDAVLAERITLDAAVQRVQSFCLVRYPIWLTWIKTTYGDHGSVAAEIRIGLLLHIRVGLQVGNYRQAPNVILSELKSLPSF
jgi:hypothetical protein